MSIDADHKGIIVPKGTLTLNIRIKKIDKPSPAFDTPISGQSNIIFQVLDKEPETPYIPKVSIVSSTNGPMKPLPIKQIKIKMKDGVSLPVVPTTVTTTATTVATNSKNNDFGDLNSLNEFNEFDEFNEFNQFNGFNEFNELDEMQLPKKNDGSDTDIFSDNLDLGLINDYDQYDDFDDSQMLVKQVKIFGTYFWLGCDIPYIYDKQGRKIGVIKENLDVVWF